jgi:hypothetical protein
MVSVRGGGRKGRSRLAVLVYRRDMPGRKRPAAEDAVTARRVLLDGLARDADIVELLSELAPLHPRNDTFPGEVFLHLAGDALQWCGVGRAEPLPLEGLRERFLPEAAFRGRQNAKLQYAVLAAAAVHGGTEPDLLDEVAFWQAGDFWQCAAYAAVAYIRAAASRAGVPVRQACQDLDEHPGHPAPCRLFASSIHAGRLVDRVQIDLFGVPHLVGAAAAVGGCGDQRAWVAT